ncbi:mini-circle protein [Nocardioides sp. LS1]|nr:mini-circle protein [Nocardioides sp. LS1]
MAAVTETSSIIRTDPPLAADEATTLRAFLDFQRDTLRMKTEGLTGEQLNQTLAPSEMTLGGMLKHLALVEHWWFACIFLGQEYAEPWASIDWEDDADWDWHSASEDSPEELRALLDREVATSDAIVDQVSDLGTLSTRKSRTGETFSLRWILVHMIEEYSRHNGHADLLRESIDGSTGE